MGKNLTRWLCLRMRITPMRVSSRLSSSSPNSNRRHNHDIENI